jgi:hypothetical protein
MARDLKEAIAEEEAREVHEADDLDERMNPKEYDDDGGENTAATVGDRRGATLEFVCRKCGKRITASHGAQPKHHGRDMTPVDREPTRGNLIGRLIEAIERVTGSVKHAAKRGAAGRRKPVKLTGSKAEARLKARVRKHAAKKSVKKKLKRKR